MDEEYDVIVLGTGLKECMISGLCSKAKLKVLHMDRNDYYGGESASMNPLEELYKKHEMPFEKAHADLRKTRGRDWNVDLIPKLIMAKEELVKILILTEVTKYLEFKQTKDSYVFKKGGQICKVPCTEKEALASSLMGLFEKRRFRNMLIYADKYDRKATGSGKGTSSEEFDPNTRPARELFKKYDLSQSTQEFVGHALAFYTDESYQDDLAADVIEKIKLYTDSLAQYHNSPFLFPLYGLGELPQAFARLSAIHGGTYMLSKDVKKIVCDDNFKVCGVHCDDTTIKCGQVVCDPSYAKDMVKVTGKVVRCICILREKTFPKSGNVKPQDSFTLIMPNQQIGCKNDIYFVMLTEEFKVCPKGFSIAIMSKIVETSNPESELSEAMQLMPEILEKFISVADIYEPLPEAAEKGVYISKSYDATSNFQTSIADVKSIINRMGMNFEEMTENVELQNLTEG